MLERRVYHVLRRSDDSWQVVREGFNRPHIIRHSKDEAIVMAKRLAKAGASARVVVHSSDDRIEREFSFSTETIER
jgi:hypothetical protein